MFAGRHVVVRGDAGELTAATAARFRAEAATVAIVPDDAAADAFFASASGRDAAIDAVVLTSTAGAIPWCEMAARVMARSGGGAIVATVSARALSGDVCDEDPAIANTAVEDAVDGAAMVALVRCLATTWGRQGIRANAIAVPPADLSRAVLRRSTPLPRLVEPSDVAHLAAFLASDDAAFVTGQVVRCDGGLLAHLPHYAFMVEADRTTVARQDPSTDLNKGAS